VYHISDEAYEYFTYDGVRHFSPGSITGTAGHTISLYSLSKAYGFAGWRVGYTVIPRTLQAAVKKIQDTNLICPPIPSQYGAMGALEVGVDYCRKHLGALAEVRELVINALSGLGSKVTVPVAQGAFYCFVRVHTNRDAMTLVRHLIETYRVAVIPGTTFGMHEGCYLRVAYGALQKETVAEAVGRLVQGLNELI
jgi:aspartate/methionine/tyrosine aminotransferase